MLQLLNTGQVGELLGVSRARVSQLQGERDDFPQPYAVTHIGPRQMFLWRPEDVEHWRDSADRTPGPKPSLRRSKAR